MNLQNLRYFAFITFLSISTISAYANQGWTPISKEQAEYDAIMLKIARINEQFSAAGAYRSSARELAIFELLKNIGTPTSYKILKELVASGGLNASWLNQV